MAACVVSRPGHVDAKRPIFLKVEEGAVRWMTAIAEATAMSRREAQNHIRALGLHGASIKERP
jgi:hypothetical protein